MGINVGEMRYAIKDIFGGVFLLELNYDQLVGVMGESMYRYECIIGGGGVVVVVGGVGRER